MQLTGTRRTIEIMLLASVASAGAVAFVLMPRPGSAVHHVFDDPPRHIRIVHTAGNELTLLIGFVSVVACLLAMLLRTPRAAIYATLTFVVLFPFCLLEPEVTGTRVYGLVETWENARLLRQAITFLTYAPAFLGLSFALLYTLEHWCRPRTALPTAQLRD